jgi:hypothetical protein
LFQSFSLLDQSYASARQMLTDYLGPAGANVPIYILENNSAWMPCDKQTTSIVNALYLAKMWGRAVTLGADSFVWWNLHNGADFTGNNHPSLYGSRQFGDFGLSAVGNDGGDPAGTRYPVSYTFELVKRLARPGDRQVNATSSNPLLYVLASKTSAGRLKLMVVNLAKGSDITTTVSISGAFPKASSTMYTYGAAQDAAMAGIRQQSVTVMGTQFTTTFPRYSVSVIEF